MKEIKNVIICGLGAVGTAFAVKILKTKPNGLRILVDKDRYERYTRYPRVLNGETLEFNYITPDNSNIKADLVIIAVKSKTLDEVINNLKNFIKEDTIILSLLNGVTSETQIARVYGWDKLLLSYFIGHSAMRTGENITHDGVATIVFGAKNNDAASVEKINLVKNYLEQTNIDYSIPNDISKSFWTKFMLNVACNQLSAILGMTFGEMRTNKKFMELAGNIMYEVELCAKAEGIDKPETMVNEVIEHLQTMIPEGKTSMLQDIEAGRETEVDSFAGTVIEIGKKHGIPTPYNEIIKQMIDTLYYKTHPEYESVDVHKIAQ